jgi:hypothetical protein
VGADRVRSGWVYALASSDTPFVKIGLTTTSPAQRIREINNSQNYGPLGPWWQVDVRVVRDVAKIERILHRQLADRRAEIANTRELFSISPAEARALLGTIPAAELDRPVPVDQLRLRPDFMAYLLNLFRTSGLENFRDIQESWTFSLFPSTSGGRYFTLNIDRHEVAYSQPIRGEEELVLHALVVDRMILRDRQMKTWLRGFNGVSSLAPYSSSWGNAAKLQFEAKFDDCLGLFENTTLRRALLAYWYDALLRMRDRGARSLFARFHDYNATSEIFRHLEERDRFSAKASGNRT